MNSYVRRLLESASYDELEELEKLCLNEGRIQLADAVDTELRRRANLVADAARNIIDALEGISRNEV